MNGKWFVECSRCHNMIALWMNKPMSKEQQRTFTCSACQREIKGSE